VPAFSTPAKTGLCAFDVHGHWRLLLRILFYNHTGRVSGAERVLLMILANLDRKRFEPAVACPDGELATSCSSLGIKHGSIEEFRACHSWTPRRIIEHLFYIVETARSLRRVIRDLPPGLIHANGVRSGIIASAATIGMRIPVLWHVHDILPRGPIGIAIRWLALFRATAIVAVSNATAERFRGIAFLLFGSHTPVRTVYNGIELEEFRPEPGSRRSKRIELELSGSQFAVGIVAQITPRKGQLELIRAFAPMARALPEATLLVVGEPIYGPDGAYLEALKRESERLGLRGQVRFLGHRKDVAGILQALDLLVLNSSSEPFAVVLLEALASGTPVLATAVDGVPELITDGRTGFLVEPGKPEDLTSRLLELARDADKRATAGRNGRLHVVNGFGTGRFQHDMEAIYTMFDTGKGKTGEDGGRRRVSR
jgi:glycosyltransferase involved in cell wall biosynthesis